MSRSRPRRKPDDKPYVTIAADHFFEFKDRPSKKVVRPARNGKPKLESRTQRMAKRDRLRPLVSMIGDCMTLARHIDAKGLDDVVETLNKAYSKALDHQFDR
jgi:hypothetical protein